MTKKYIEIPLDLGDLVLSLTDEQAGAVFKALIEYVFNDIEPDFKRDTVLRDAFVKIIRQCRKVEDYGISCCTTSYEDYEV